MDSTFDQPLSAPVDEEAALSYDDTVPYEAQVGPSLVNRIGATRVYLFSESSVASKRKRRDEDEMEDETAAEDPTTYEEHTKRSNAILLQGAPVAHLPTARIFAYATHFDATPMGLEWVDDTTCILVFSTPVTARSAMQRLHRPASTALDLDPEAMSTEADADDFGDTLVPARLLPLELWPPETRIATTLGQEPGDVLRGALHIRWARGGDVKRRGAKKESVFYRKHGEKAGKDMIGPFGALHDRLGEVGGRAKRQRHVTTGMDDQDAEVARARLDDELDALKQPKSKMRSDYLVDGRARSPPSNILSELTDKNGRSLLSRMDGEGGAPLDDSNTGGRHRRPRGGRDRRRVNGEGGGSGEGGSRRAERPRKTQQELDDELEAFLGSK